jgi:hypothetical protein
VLETERADGPSLSINIVTDEKCLKNLRKGNFVNQNSIFDVININC